MAAGSTYTPLATQTLGSATASVTFSSISGAYTDLVLVVAAGVDGATSTYIRHRYNSSGTANYSVTILTGDGSSAASSRSSGDSYGYMGVLLASATNFSVNVTSIQNYANTTTYKTHLTRGNNAALKTDAEVGLWRDTSAISSITLYPGTLTNFVAGSTFSLYGIAAA